MATIHRTTMVPTKLELITAWLPRQLWFRATGAPPALRPAGGFRLDDPAGEVGLEFILVTDGAQGGETTYFVPLSYRGAPLAGAEQGLVGTSEHGVLGLRWVYDAAADPVAIAQLLAFMRGEAEAQHQHDSDTPDPSVARHWTADDGAQPAVELVRLPQPGDGAAAPGTGSVEAGWTRADGTTARGTVVVARRPDRPRDGDQPTS
ncbi:maltokinase N-terminal cap-like domain-containing protein [Blastococcus sp. SYSU DS0539]